LSKWRFSEYFLSDNSGPLGELDFETGSRVVQFLIGGHEVNQPLANRGLRQLESLVLEHALWRTLQRAAANFSSPSQNDTRGAPAG